MQASCLACLENGNLYSLNETDLNILDYLLHPHNKTYLKNLRHKTAVQICINCRLNMRNIDTFRNKIVKNGLHRLELLRVSEFQKNKQSGTMVEVAKDIQETKLSQHMTDLPSTVDTRIPVKKENPSPEPLLTEELAVEFDPVNDLYSKNMATKLPSSPNTTVPVKKEYSSPEPLLADELILKSEPLDDDNEGNFELEKSAVEKDNKTDLSKIMLNNILQNMFVAKLPVPAAKQVVTNTVVNQPGNQTSSLLRQLLNVRQKAPNKVQQDTACDGENITNIPVAVPEQVHSKSRVKCKICNKYVGAYYLKSHMKVHENALFCELCCKWYSQATYQTHLKTATIHVNPEQYKFACDLCGARFNRNTHVRRHLQKVHKQKKQKVYKCGKCPSAFEEQRRLTTHIKWVHASQDGPRNFVCDICDIAMTCKRNLAAHIVRHTGARPYKCKLCDASFGYSGTLATHNKLQHGHHLKRSLGEKKRSI